MPGFCFGVLAYFITMLTFFDIYRKFMEICWIYIHLEMKFSARNAVK